MDKHLTLEALLTEFPELSPGLVGFHFEHSLIALGRFGHLSGVELSVKKNNADEPDRFTIAWTSEITEVMRKSWADPDENTEFAACGIAFLLIIALTPFTVIERSRRGTGFDYWLGNRDTTKPFQRAARLEVSGIGKAENTGVVQTRVKQKIGQIKRRKATIPGYVIVVEFSRPLAQVTEYESGS